MAITPDPVTAGEIDPTFHAPPAASDVPGGDTARDVAEKREDSLAEANKRLRAIVDRHYDFLWRTLRYLGLPDASIEDAAQQVLCVLARRLHEVAPTAEMSFIFATAVRVASEARRTARRRPDTRGEQAVDDLAASVPSPDDLLDERREHETLREIIAEIPLDVRPVFILFEIEELTIAEVAAVLEIPTGTVSSRLRRARESFQSIVRRRHAAERRAGRGGIP